MVAIKTSSCILFLFEPITSAAYFLLSTSPSTWKGAIEEFNGVLTIYLLYGLQTIGPISF